MVVSFSVKKCPFIFIHLKHTTQLSGTNRGPKQRRQNKKTSAQFETAMPTVDTELNLLTDVITALSNYTMR